MAKILELKNIKKHYGEIEVLHGLSFELNEGDFTSIIGQSGSGKSTLLNIIGTLDYEFSGLKSLSLKNLQSLETMF